MATRIGARLPYRVFKDSGDVCTDATITFYLANTTTLQEVFSDKELTTTLGSTVSCNSVGVVPDIWVSDAISIKAIIAGTGVTSDTIDYLTVAASTVAGTTTGDFALGNAIVNGGLSAWTPGTSYSNISGSGTGVEVADDIYFVQSTAASNAISRQTANGTQARYCMRVGRPASSTSTNKLRIWGTIPTDECYRLRGQEVTFSFRVKAGATFSGTALGVRIATGTTEAESGDLIEASGFAGNANPLNTTQAITTTATRYEFTCTLSSTLKNLGWQLAYTGVGTAGATDHFEVEDLQIEIASAATSFKVVPEPLDYLRANLTTGGRLVAASTFTDPGADRVLGWDDSAGAVIGFTFGTGITTNATAIELDADLVTWSGITPAAGIATWLAAPSSANLAAAMTDEVGTGALYFTGGALGTPASATLTNATGLPVSTGISGLGTGVATFLATPSASNLVAAVTGGTVWHSGNDGSGSGLDADLLDGLSSAAFAQLAAENIFTMSEAGDYQALAARNTSANSAAYTSIYLGNDTAANRGGMFMNSSANTNFGGAGSVNVGSFANVPVALVHNSVVRAYVSASGLTDASGNVYFTTANDGAGSGLDADLLDGKNIGTSGNTVPLLDGANTWSAAQTYSANVNLNDNIFIRLGALTSVHAYIRSTATNLTFGGFTANDGAQNWILNADLTTGVWAFPATPTVSGNTVWHAGNDGSGSGLDADLLDGKNIGTSGNTVPLLDGANTFSGATKFTSNLGHEANDPLFWLKDNDGGADAKYWLFYPTANQLGFYTWNDAQNSLTTWLTVSRSGATPVTANFTTTNLHHNSVAVLTTATGAQLASNNVFTGGTQTIDHSSDTPILDFKASSVLKGEVYWLSNVFGIYAAASSALKFWAHNTAFFDLTTAGILSATGGGTIQAPAAVSSETTGTLTSASSNKTVNATGGVTINDGVHAAGDRIEIYAGSTARTITQDTGMTLRLDGTSTTGNRTLAAYGRMSVYFVSNSEAICSGSGVS